MSRAWKSLEKFDRDVTKARAALREVSRDAENAQSEATRLTDALTDAMIDGKIQIGGEPVDDAGRKLHADLALAKARVAEPWAERIRAAQVRADRADSRRVEHLRAHATELFAEAMPDAEAWPLEVTAVLEAAMKVIDRYDAISSPFREVLAALPGGVNRNAMPENPLGQIRREMQRAMSKEITPPIPYSLRDDLNPVISSAA